MNVNDVDNDEVIPLGNMSLRPGFIESRVLCVCNCYATFFATFCKFVATFFWATFETFVATFRATFLLLLATYFATKSCKEVAKIAKQVAKKKLQFFLAKKLGGEVAKQLLKSCITVTTKLQKKLHKVANTEPGTQ